MTLRRIIIPVILVVGVVVLVVTTQCLTPEPQPDDEVVESPTSDKPEPEADEDDQHEEHQHELVEQDRSEQPLQLTFVDAGQAHALHIQKGSLDILVDAGQHYNEELRQAMDGITGSLDLLVITHPHDDHFGGAIDLLGEHKVDQVITNGERRGPPRDDDHLVRWTQFEEAVDEAGLELEAREEGDQIELTDHLTIEVLASGGDFENTSDGTDINNDSLVLMVEYADRRILLPGDIEVDGGELLVNRHCSDRITGCDDEVPDCPALRADVMKVPHHGSHHFCHSFFEAVSPTVSVFGAPHDNRQHYHPRKDTLRALVDLDSRIKSTNKRGGTNVELTISPDGDKAWNVEDPEIFVWPEHGAEEGKACEILADGDGGVEKDCGLKND